MTTEFVNCSSNDRCRFTVEHHRDLMAGVLAISSSRLLDGSGGEPAPATVLVDGGAIVAVGADVSVPAAAEIIDVGDLLVAPGLIDLHGDAFERCIMPRPRVFMPLALALRDNAEQLASVGISTAYLSATDSWEPGLRSRATLRDLVVALGGEPFPIDVRLHVRRETTAVDDFFELAAWVRSGAVSLLSFADHTPERVDDGFGPSATQLDRTGCTVDEFRVLLTTAVGQRQTGARQDQALSWLAESIGCVTASHDGGSHDDVQRDRALGVDIAEFPMSIEVAAAYRTAGMTTLFGAPNLVRGGSHLGNLSVSDVVDPDAGDVLCSDYHYPSLLQAPFAAVEQGLCSLGQAWKLVSANPAAAARLDDRGVLAAGMRADIAVIDDRGPVPFVSSLYAGGRSVYRSSVPSVAERVPG